MNKKSDGLNIRILEIAKEELSLSEIARQVGCSIEKVRQYLKRNTNYEQRLNTRKKYCEQKRLAIRCEEGRNSLSIISEVLFDRFYAEANPAEKTAAKLRIQRRGTLIPYNALVRMFQNYHDSRRNCERPSLRELTKGTSIYSYSAARILRKACLEQPNGTRPKARKHHLNQKQKEDIQRALRETDCSVTDLAYFAELSDATIRKEKKLIFKNLNPRKIFNVSFSENGNKSFLGYRLASEIYRSIDERFFEEFPEEEVIEMLGTRKDVADYAMSKRDEISQKIIIVLNILYPEGDITKPYLTKQPSN